jgi:hypothetical protein
LAAVGVVMAARGEKCDHPSRCICLNWTNGSDGWGWEEGFIDKQYRA